MHSSDGAISDDGDDYVMGSSAFSSAMNLQHSGKWPSDHKKCCNMIKIQALNDNSVQCTNGFTKSDIVGNDTVKIMTSPSPVGNMTVTSSSVDQLTVTWTPGGVPTSYSVTINGSSSPVVIADNGSPVYTHTFTGLVSDTLYTVSVVAINCAGSSTNYIKENWVITGVEYNTCRVTTHAGSILEYNTCRVNTGVQHMQEAHSPANIQIVSVLNPNHTFRHLEVFWIPVAGSVSVYTVRVVGDGGTSVGHGSTKCTTSPCLFVQQVNVPATSYTIFVASINGDGEEGPENNSTVNNSFNYLIKYTSLLSYYGCVAMTDCSFSNNQSFYCMVCCSTDPSVPPDSSVYNISTTRGTEVTVSLQGLTSGQMYYCKAAATNTNSNNCAGPVVGGVKVFFSFMASPIPQSEYVPNPVSRHNRVRDTLFEFCQRACLGAQLEAGSSLGHEARQARPADVLIPNWELGKPAAVDLCVTSPLNSNTLQVACVTPNSAAMQAEQRKHHSNDAKCEELGWVCIPLVVESYGSWGPEAQRCLSRLAGRLATTQLGQPKSLTTNLIYGRLNLTLIRANSRAILSRLYVS
eukprot:Em0006g48a